MKKLLSFLIVLLVFVNTTNAQIVTHLSLPQAINMAHNNSLQAAIAKHNFVSSYWGYRSYKATFLPSLNLQGDIGNYNRSINRLQDAQTGEILYRETNNLSNSLSLSVDQNIPFTGGTLSLYTSLERIDQFGDMKSVTYYSQPLSLSYLQPIGGFNAFKWNKKIEPKRYDLAKKTFVEDMERITVNTVELFFNLIIDQNNLLISKRNFDNTSTLYNIAKERFSIGTVTKNDLLQLELRLLNDSMAISDMEINYKISRFKLKNYLGLYESDDISLTSPQVMPTLEITNEKVFELWNRNSSFMLDSEVKRLTAQSEIARAKGTGGVDIMLNARFGLTQTGETFSSAFHDLNDQEVVGLRVKVPILDWGERRGKIKMAQSRKEVVESQIKQNYEDKLQDIAMKVMRFNAQNSKCFISAKANKIADERYNIVMQRFKNGNISVTDANNAQSEQDNATKNYINDLKSLWLLYYQLREITLYDFITQTDITNKIDETILKQK